jgi:hypothetical protein
VAEPHEAEKQDTAPCFISVYRRFCRNVLRYLRDYEKRSGERNKRKYQ